MSELLNGDGELFSIHDLESHKEALALLFGPEQSPKLSEALDRVKGPDDDRDTAMAKLIAAMGVKRFLEPYLLKHPEAMDALGLLAKPAGVKTTAALLRLIGNPEETCEELALLATFREKLAETLFSFVANSRTGDETLKLCNAWLSSSDSRIGPLAKDTGPSGGGRTTANEPPEWRCNQAALMLAMIGAFLDYVESGWLDLDAFGTADPVPAAKFAKKHEKSVARLRSLIATGGVGGGEVLFDTINGRLISIHTTQGKERRLTKIAWVGRAGLPGCFPSMSRPAYSPLFNCTVIVSPTGEKFVTCQTHLPKIEDWDDHHRRMKSFWNFDLKFNWLRHAHKSDFWQWTADWSFRTLAPCLVTPPAAKTISNELAAMWNATPLINAGVRPGNGNLVGGPVFEIDEIIENPYDEENRIDFYRLCIAAFCRKLIELVVAEKPPFAIDAAEFVGKRVEWLRREYKTAQWQPIPCNPATEEMSKTLPWLRKMLGMFDGGDDNWNNQHIEFIVKAFAKDFETLYEPFAAQDQDKELREQVFAVNEKPKGMAKGKPNDASL